MIIILLFSSFFSIIDGWVRMQGTGTNNYYLSPNAEAAVGGELSWNMRIRGKKAFPFYRGLIFNYPTSYAFEGSIWQEIGITGVFENKMQTGLGTALSLPTGSYSDFGYFQIRGWFQTPGFLKVRIQGIYKNYFWESITDNFELYSRVFVSLKTRKINFIPSILGGWKLYTGQTIIQETLSTGRWGTFYELKTVTILSNAFRINLSGILYIYPDPWTTISIWLNRNLIFGDSIPDWSSFGIISDQELFQSPYNYDGWEFGFSLYWDLPLRTQLRLWFSYADQFYPYAPVKNSAGYILYYGRKDKIFSIQNEIEKGIVGRWTSILEIGYTYRSSNDYFRNYNAFRIGLALRLHI